MTNVNKMFGRDGLLQQAIPGFTAREAQTQMATAVQKSIKDKQTLVVEAGTGTGKTYAYLAPAFAAENNKVIISTGTKNLQEQLYHRDLPVVRKALSSGKRVALLKGRSNYLCEYRLQKHASGTHLLDKRQLNDLSLVRQWAATTRSGDIGEIKTLAEDSPVLPLVTSTVDNCMGRECPQYDDCYLLHARSQALEADVVVVNHHLFFADLALKDTGFGELIPDADVIIFDEAHQIADIASDYFGQAVSTRQLQEMCKNADAVARTTVKDAAQISAMADKLSSLSADLRLALPSDPEKGRSDALLAKPDFELHLTRVNDALKGFQQVLKVHLGRDKELDSIYEKLTQLKQTFADVLPPGDKEVSYWYETTQRHLVLHQTPLNIADKFAAIVEEKKRSWIFTSATLTVGEGFEHFTRPMGLTNAKTLQLDSPFDYQRQALLCVPRYLPEPASRSMAEPLLEIAVKLINASKGRCFLLFTSYAMLNKIAEMLAQRLDNPLLIQGTSSKRALLDSYLEQPNSVLLGTSAFWEGVDVRGEDLICVLIDKLPFAAPDDPLLQAKAELINQRGGKAFFELQIPEAVIALKQGAGRLIRDGQDKGVLVICDNRLVTKEYGKTFIASLPPMRRTRSIDEAVVFLKQIQKD